MSDDGIRIVPYAPQGQILEDFMLSTAPVRVILGPLGSGKSTACCFVLWMAAATQPPDENGRRASRFLIIRNTYPELEQSTCKTWRHWFQDIPGWRNSMPFRHQVHYDLPDSSRVDAEFIFISCDRQEDLRKFLSVDLTAAWLNEAKELPKGLWDTIEGRVGRYPPARPGIDGGEGFIIADSNMPEDGSYLHHMFEEKKPSRWARFRQSGGLIRVGEDWQANKEAENLDYLPGGSRYYTKHIETAQEDWLRVYCAGEYGFVETDGKPVWADFSDTLHTVGDPQPLDGAPLGVGMDFGLTPCAVIGQLQPGGRLVILDELIGDDIDITAFSEALRAHMISRWPDHSFTLWGDPAGTQRSQIDKQTPFSVLQAAGIDARPAHTNAVDERIEAVSHLLRQMSAGKPQLMIGERCKTLRRSMAGRYRFRLIGPDQSRYGPRPEKTHPWSDIADALQYLVVSNGHSAIGKRKKVQATAAASNFEVLG